MSPEYNAGFIWQTLQGNNYCVVASHAADGTINTRVMAFACEKDLRIFYIVTQKTAAKLKDFAENPDISVHVFTKAKDLGDYSQVAVKGRISMHTDIHSPVVQCGLRLYAEKTGIMKSLLENDSLGDFVFLALEPKEIAFSVFRDIMRNLPGIKIGF